MNPAQLAVMAINAEAMRDALLGSFIVQTLKTEDSGEYESLLAYFMTRPSFCEALDQINDQIFGEVPQ